MVRFQFKRSQTYPRFSLHCCLTCCEFPALLFLNWELFKLDKSLRESVSTVQVIRLFQNSITNNNWKCLFPNILVENPLEIGMDICDSIIAHLMYKHGTSITRQSVVYWLTGVMLFNRRFPCIVWRNILKFPSLGKKKQSLRHLQAPVTSEIFCPDRKLSH